MKLQRDFRYVLTLLGFLLVMTGCASMGIVQPQTFDQRWSYAVGLEKSVIQATDSSLNAGAVSITDAEVIQKQAQTALDALHLARTAADSGDQTGADNKLAISLTVLTALQDYLRSHGGKT